MVRRDADDHRATSCRFPLAGFLLFVTSRGFGGLASLRSSCSQLVQKRNGRSDWSEHVVASHCQLAQQEHQEQGDTQTGKFCEAERAIIIIS